MSKIHASMKWSLECKKDCHTCVSLGSAHSIKVLVQPGSSVAHLGALESSYLPVQSVKRLSAEVWNSVCLALPDTLLLQAQWPAQWPLLPFASKGIIHMAYHHPHLSLPELLQTCTAAGMLLGMLSQAGISNMTTARVGRKCGGNSSRRTCSCAAMGEHLQQQPPRPRPASGRSCSAPAAHHPAPAFAS